MARLLALAEAASLPGVEPGTSYGRPALKVGGKAFVTLREAQTLVLHVPHEHKALLMEMAPALYYQTSHFEGWPAVLMRLDAADDAELRQRLVDAWRHRAPKRLASAYAASASRAQTGR